MLKNMAEKHSLDQVSTLCTTWARFQRFQCPTSPIRCDFYHFWLFSYFFGDRFYVFWSSKPKYVEKYGWKPLIRAGTNFMHNLSKISGVPMPYNSDKVRFLPFSAIFVLFVVIFTFFGPQSPNMLKNMAKNPSKYKCGKKISPVNTNVTLLV